MLFLIEANEQYTDELEQFKNEVLICDKDDENQFAGCMGLRNCSAAKEWIDICNLRKKAETCERAGAEVPSTTYFAVRESDNRLVGVIDLRHHIDHPILGTWGGHCGYTVRPSERGKGYGLCKGNAQTEYSECQRNGNTKTSCDMRREKYGE